MKLASSISAPQSLGRTNSLVTEARSISSRLHAVQVRLCDLALDEFDSHHIHILRKVAQVVMRIARSERTRRRQKIPRHGRFNVAAPQAGRPAFGDRKS